MCFDIENDTQHGVNRKNDSGIFMDSGLGKYNTFSISASLFRLVHRFAFIIQHSVYFAYIVLIRPPSD